MTTSERTSDDLKEIIDCAKLDSSDIGSICQSIQYGDILQYDGMRILEVDKDMLNYLKKGEKMIIRGKQSDQAVLCTDNKTYDVKIGQTSNSVLIMESLLFPEDIQAHCSNDCTTNDVPNIEVRPTKVYSIMKDFLEARPCKGKTQRIQELLQESVYTGRQDEGSKCGKMYTIDDLLDVVQASEEEIKKALSKINALKLNGNYRILGHQYALEVLNSILNFIEENSWSFENIKLKQTLDTLEELYHRDVIYHCLRCYGNPKNEEDLETSSVSENIEYSLDEVKICRFYAKDLLFYSDKFNYNAFLESWQQMVPVGMKTSISQIRDMCIIDEKSYPQTISYFPVNDLPESASDRFSFLFKKRERWSKEEIEPFIKDLTTPKADVNALLTKFARSTVIKGVKVFNSRRTMV